MLAEMDRGALLGLLLCYDRYIQRANDDRRYREGWQPVCVAEYAGTEEFAIDAAMNVYPDTEDKFEAQGGVCLFCGRTEYGEHSDSCPVAEGDALLDA